jgi:hypothetical protein
MWLWLYHSPVARMTFIGFVTAAVLDIDAFITFRKANPGATFDWSVAFAQALKGTAVAWLGAMGVSTL